jgi:hypothetical protein
LPHPPPLHLPNAAWVALWGVFLLAHWKGLSWINHRHPGVWHVLLISVHSACRISQCHSHHTVDRAMPYSALKISYTFSTFSLGNCFFLNVYVN